MFDLIVIGGGPAGVTAALRGRELGASVALIERAELGGTCTNDGCAPTRVLAKAARLMRDSSQFASYGLEGERPSLDWLKLMEQTQAAVYALHEKKQLLNRLREVGVNVYERMGETRFLDAHTLVLADGTPLQARKFILCVGGHARRLNFPGAEFALTPSDIWSLKRLPHSVAIVGAAATGCQLASILNEFGAQVSLLEVMPRTLPGEDEAVSQLIDREFKARGIAVSAGIKGVSRIEPIKNGLRLVYTQGNETKTLDVEEIILSVGWVGNIETLNLDTAGVQTARGYIVVDDYLRTSAPNIFAAGDITGRMMLVQSASAEARAAAENALADSMHAYQHRIVPHGGFTDPEYGSVGLTEAQAQAQGPHAVATVPYSEMDRAVIDEHTVGLCKLIVSLELHQVIGAHVVGEQALEVTQMIAAGMAAGIRVEQLAELEIAYPTYAAIVGLAARRIVSDLGIMPLAPEWRTLGARYTAEWEWRDK